MRASVARPRVRGRRRNAPRPAVFHQGMQNTDTGFLAILQHQITAMGTAFVAALPGIALAIVVLVATSFLARFAVQISDTVFGKTRLRPNLRQLGDTLIKVAIWIAGLLVAATIVIPGFTAAQLIAGLGIGAVAIGFAFQDIFENFLAGVLLMLRDSMRIGDTIEVEDFNGVVEKITLRETHLRIPSGELVIMPNSTIFKNPVKVLTSATEKRDEAIVGVSYDTDLRFAAGVVRKAVEKLDFIRAQKGVTVTAKEFATGSVDLLVQWWIPATGTPGVDMRLEVLSAIKKALEMAGIEQPDRLPDISMPRLRSVAK